MNIDATIFGQLIAVLDLVVISLTVYYAKDDKKKLPLVTVYSFIFNILFPPLGWYYCWKIRKHYKLHKAS